MAFEVSQSGEMTSKSLLSNESIIFSYLSAKLTVINIDKKLKELEIYIKEKDEDFENQLKNGKFSMILKAISQQSGGEIDAAKYIRDQKDEQLNKFKDKIIKDFNNSMSYNIRIVTELQLAFDVLKDIMPEYVEQVSNHLMQIS